MAPRMNLAEWCTCGHDISAHREGTGECNPCGASGVGEDGYPNCARFESITSVMAQRALPTPGEGCSCGWYSEDRVGGCHESMQEYDPACPEHSEHVYNPRTGVWEHAPRPEAVVKVEALREAASDEVAEWARKLVEDELIELRDARISLLGRHNGLVVYEKDGEPSHIIRLGFEMAWRRCLTDRADLLTAEAGS